MVIHAIYENGVFRPISAVELPENCKVDLTIADLPTKPEGEDSAKPLLGLAAIATQHPENPDLPTDLAREHDHYLYNAPKQP